MKCSTCGHSLGIGEWPFCPHGRTLTRKGFEPYEDPNISHDGKPVWIATPGDRKKYMRPQWVNDTLQHIDFADPKDKSRFGPRKQEINRPAFERAFEKAIAEHGS